MPDGFALDGFSGFRDDAESPFACADGLTPEATWEASLEELALALTELPARCPMRVSPELLVEWHAQIFKGLFPTDAGRVRSRRDGEWEEVFFGANVGTRNSLRHKQYKGVHPNKLNQRLKAICAEANEGMEAVRRHGNPPLRAATLVAARFYAKVLRAHPFVDGNLRAAYVGLSAVLLSVDLLIVEFKDLEIHDDLLGTAFRGDNDPYHPLAAHIADIILTAAET